MIELPEAVTLALQLERALGGRRIDEVEVNHSPHAFAGYFGDPAAYPALLTGRTVATATSWGGMVEIVADDARLVLGDGANPRLFAPGALLPAKHQLRLRFDDGATLIVSVQMYGAIQAFHDGELDNPYYEVAVTTPSPLTDDFDDSHVRELLDDPRARKGSVKALLATEQRIPGLGNGTLQDILWSAEILPTRRVDTLTDDDIDALFASVRTTLATMTERGGRNTEHDLFGEPGGYETVMSRVTIDVPCPRCGAEIVKKAFLGGAVYYCAGCQF